MCDKRSRYVGASFCLRPHTCGRCCTGLFMSWCGAPRVPKVLCDVVARQIRACSARRKALLSHEDKPTVPWLRLMSCLLCCPFLRRRCGTLRFTLIGTNILDTRVLSALLPPLRFPPPLCRAVLSSSPQPPSPAAPRAVDLLLPLQQRRTLAACPCPLRPPPLRRRRGRTAAPRSVASISTATAG